MARLARTEREVAGKTTAGIPVFAHAGREKPATKKQLLRPFLCLCH